MFDGSHLPLDENIKTTKKLHLLKSGEIGCVGGSEDGSEDIAINCTKPEDAVRFENETGVDALAMLSEMRTAITKSTPKLRV